jgi:hypothetical protein
VNQGITASSQREATFSFGGGCEGGGSGFNDVRNSAVGVPGELHVIGDREVVLECKKKINRYHRRSRCGSLEAEGAVAVWAHLRGHGEESFNLNLTVLERGPGERWVCKWRWGRKEADFLLGWHE